MDGKWVVGGGVVSGLLMAALLWLHAGNPSFFDLEARWIAVAALPLLVGLLAGGVIKRFSGFGIELEASLEAPVSRLIVQTQRAVVDLPGEEKQSIAYLHQLTEEQRQEIRRLAFNRGRIGYYAPHAISMFLKALPHLEYFEIRQPNGKFQALVPAQAIRALAPQDDAYGRFIAMMQENNLEHLFGTDVISETVKANEELVDVLERVRLSKFGILPVVDRSRRMIGIVTTGSIEREIANAVLRVRGKLAA